MSGKKCHKKKPSLNPKQLRFCQEYIKDLNATQAAIRAKYSKKTAYVQGPRLLDNVGIREKIQELADKRAANLEITSDRVLQEIALLAFSDTSKLFDENGCLLPISQLPESVTRSISSIEVVTKNVPGSDPVEVEHIAKIKLWDKRGSLELAGKHLKLFTDKVEHSGGVTLIMEK